MDLQEETFNKFWSGFDLTIPKPDNNIIYNLLKKNKKVLEIGPGISPSAVGKNMYFFDVSTILEEKYKSLGYNFTQGDCINMPYKNEEFDLVIAKEILEHITDDKKALEEINRILKKKGYLILSVPLNQKFWTKWDDLSNHIRRYNIADLSTKLKNSGFTIEKFYLYNTASKIQLNAAAYVVNTLFFLHLEKLIKILYRHVIECSSSIIENELVTKNLMEKADYYEHIYLQCIKI